MDTGSFSTIRTAPAGWISVSEELLQTSPVPIGRYLYHRLGASTLSQLRRSHVITATVPKKFARRKPDGLVVLGGSVRAWIEYRLPENLATQDQVTSLIEGTRHVAKALCNLLIITDSNRTHWINPHTGRPAQALDPVPRFDAKQIVDRTATMEELQSLERAIDQCHHSLTPDNDFLETPTVVDPSQLARSVWQKIWLQTGKEAEKCLYNVVELFIFKFLSDLAVLDRHMNFSTVLELSKTQDPDAALNLYANLTRPKISALFPAGVDHTTIINGTIFVNEKGKPNPVHAGLFAEVLEDLADFDGQHGSFRYIDPQFKTRLYETFLRQGAGLHHLGQYFTPRNVVATIIDMSPAGALFDGASICDPFCGVGGFLLEAILRTPRLRAQYEPVNGVITPEVSLVGYDKGSDEKDDERTIVLAKANAIVYLTELIATHNDPELIAEIAEKVVNPMFTLLRTNVGTFGLDHQNRYDLILTNPPYVTRGSASFKRALETEGHMVRYPAPGRGVESLAIQWVIRSLKPHGTAFLIVPDGLCNQTPMLDYIKSQCIVRAIVSLPIRTFYSTPKKTYILVIERKAFLSEQQNTPVFTHLVSEIGESRDARRWNIEENNLPAMAALYNQFKGSPSTFTSDDPRCRVVPWADFSAYEHWMVDRYWSKKQLEAFGIVDSVGQIGVDELNQLLAQVGGQRQFGSEGDIQTREVLLGDTDLFSLRIGQRVLKSDCVPSGIPCISANVRDVFGYIEESTLLDGFDQPSITWGIDGIFDWHFMPAGRPFHPTDHCGVLRLKTDAIDPEYLYHPLRATRDRPGFDRTYRAKLENIKQVSVEVPISSDGSFDLRRQQELAVLHHNIQDEQNRLQGQLKMLEGIVEARVALYSS